MSQGTQTAVQRHGLASAVTAPPCMGGWTCRHSFFPFFEGISEAAYSKAELNAYAHKKVMYNGKEISFYEATQYQRAIERKIRYWKRQADALKSAGQDNTFELSKVKGYQAQMRDFIKQTGLNRQSAREGVIKIGNLETIKTTGNKTIDEIQKWYKGDLSNVKINTGENARGAAGFVGYDEKIYLSENIGNDFEAKTQEIARLEKSVSRIDRRLQEDELPKELKDFLISQKQDYENRIKNYIPYTVAKNKEDILVHELGHIVQGQLEIEEIKGIKDLLPPSKNPLSYDKTLFVKFSEMRISYPVSEYGITDFDEYFAESFVLYNRKEYEKIHPDLLELFKRITKQ